MTGKEKIMKRNKQKFLKNIKKSRGHINNACRLSGFTYRTLINYRQNDPEFDELVAQAVDEEKGKFGEDLSQAFINKTLGERRELTDEEGNPIKDEDGNIVYEYMGGDTVAMIWASKNVSMNPDGTSWSDKKQLEVSSGGKTMLFLPADADIEDAEVVETKELPENTTKEE